MARETFHVLLECNHSITTDTDLPWSFYCPTCKTTKGVLISRQVTKKGNPI